MTDRDEKASKPKRKPFENNEKFQNAKRQPWRETREYLFREAQREIAELRNERENDPDYLNLQAQHEAAEKEQVARHNVRFRQWKETIKELQRENTELKKLLPLETSASALDEWEEPISLVHKPDPLPTECFGPIISPLVEQMSEAYQVPSDLVANIALPLITTAARGYWRIELTRAWIETLSLATISALSSGERKSAVVRALMAPLQEFEKEVQEKALYAISDQRAIHQLLTERVALAKKEAIKGSAEKLEQFQEVAAELAKARVDALPRWLADDVTPEKLVQILAEQQGSLGVISAEPTLARILSGRYSGKPNIESVLKATSGDPIRVDRTSRDSVTIDHTALSIGLCIQPGLLTEFGLGPYRESGLLARFLYVLPDAMVGTRELHGDPVSRRVQARWRDGLRAIAEKAVSRNNSGDIGYVFATLRVDNDARVALNQFRLELEPRLHPKTGDLAGIADWGSKLPGAIARIAAALTLIENADAKAINHTTMENAIQVGVGYIDHTTAAFGIVHAKNDDLRRAAEVLDWIKQHGKSVVTVREVYKGIGKRSWVSVTEDVRTAFHTLIKYGHVRIAATDKSGPGRPSEVYQVYPNHITNIPKK